MRSTSYRYTFDDNVPFEEVESTLLMAVISTESLFGEALVRLDANHKLDRRTRSCHICTDTRVGRTVNRLFAGYLTREFGDSAFVVKRIAQHTPGIDHPA